MSPEHDGGNDSNGGGDEQATGTSDTGASPIIPIQPPSSEGDEARQKDDCKSTALNTESPEKADDKGNGSSPAKATSIDEESAMDDLD
jgi:hypothetical protein